MYQIHSDFTALGPKAVTEEALSEIMESRVVNVSMLTAPIIIQKIELIFNYGTYFVRTTSKDGLVGIGVCNDRVKFCYQILEQQIAPFFIGKDARDLEALMDQVYVYEANYKLVGLPFYNCMAYLELSILDMLAKAAKCSIGELFGKRIHETANIYVASGNRHTTPEEELEVLRARVERSGAKAIKYKIGGRMSKNADSMEGRSEELIYATRKFFGDKMIIHADGNGSYDVEHAIRYGKILEDINAYFYEEPCPFEDIWSTKAVRDGLTIPLAFGEQETSLTRFKWLIANNGVDVLQPDILYNGGLIRTTKVAKMAELAGKPITPHVSSGFCFVYILILSSYTPNIGKYQESKTGYDIAKALLGDKLAFADGQYRIPDTIGVGVDEKHEILKEAICLFDVH